MKLWLSLLAILVALIGHESRRPSDSPIVLQAEIADLRTKLLETTNSRDYYKREAGLAWKQVQLVGDELARYRYPERFPDEPHCPQCGAIPSAY